MRTIGLVLATPSHDGDGALADMKKDELLRYAQERGVEVAAGARKADIIGAITAGDSTVATGEEIHDGDSA